MGATFYIHIGLPKTGTSSIQKTLYNNRDQLLEHGINYLSMRANHGTIFKSLMRTGQHGNFDNFMRRASTLEKFNAFNDKLRKQLTEELSGNRSAKFVISGESLPSLPKRKLRTLKQMLDPFAKAYRVIAYMRDPYEYANSATVQRVKSGYSFEEANKDIPLPNYRRGIVNFGQVFGGENVDIRVYDPRRFADGDLIADFLAAIGESAELNKKLKPVFANQSVSHEALLLLSEINIVLPELVDGVRNPARLPDTWLLMASVEGQKFTIDPQAYLKQEADVRAEVEWLHQKIGEVVFTNPKLRQASTALWNETTIRSIQKVVKNIAQEIHHLNESGGPPEKYNIAVPAGLEWLEDSVKPADLGQDEAQSAVVSPLDQSAIRALAFFIHELAFTVRKMKRQAQAAPLEGGPRVGDQADTLRLEQRMLP
jgi:hypothetical protein